jgi:hypothetical protein
MNLDSDKEAEGMELSAPNAKMDALTKDYSFQDPKMSCVLTCIPQVLPIECCIKLFHSLLQTNKLKTQGEAEEYPISSSHGGYDVS